MRLRALRLFHGHNDALARNQHHMHRVRAGNAARRAQQLRLERHKGGLGVVTAGGCEEARAQRRRRGQPRVQASQRVAQNAQPLIERS
jgi:hypothetical protein